MQRLDNWHIAFDTFLRNNMTKPFAWGVNDCCLFAANAVPAITGIDIADAFRGKYIDQASAFALIKTATGGTSVTDAIAFCATKYDITEWTHSLMARRGDLVAVSNDNTIIAGVVDLSGRWVACMGETGIVRVPIANIVRAWRIG